MPKTKRGVTEIENYHAQDVKDAYQVTPSQIIELKALMGDASDHIPGVKGIGEKTAISLLVKYGTLDNLYANIDSVTGKTKEKLINDKDNAYMSYDLATIYRQVPLDFTLEDCKYNFVNNEKLVSILEELEFHSLLRKLSLDTGVPSKKKKLK